VEPNRHGWNAAQGLNRGLDQADTPWVVFSHQDVLFPTGWRTSVTRMLSSMPDSVAVVGLVGTRVDGRYRGHIVDPNGRSYWGPLPADVLALDEVVLVLRRGSGLRFDEEVPGFHCYGTDLCLRARSRGLRVMAVDAAVRHLSSGRIDESYDKAARWILERWGKEFGYIIPTPATILEDLDRASFLRHMLFRWRRRQDRRIRHRIPRGVRIDETP
jgi:GT2 family glycosyltransferase